MNILFLLSSPRNGESHSSRIARGVVDELKARHPDARVIVRNVARNPLPHVGEAFVTGLAQAPEKRGPAAAQALAVSDALVAELEATDIVVISAPMHNFGVPSTLKAWIDHVVRAGRTFTYTAQGPVPLLKGKKAVLVLSRGGVYSNGPMKHFDFQESYLRSVLGFIGITDVQVVHAEGLDLGADALRSALASAKTRAEALVREMAYAA